MANPAAKRSLLGAVEDVRAELRSGGGGGAGIGAGVGAWDNAGSVGAGVGIDGGAGNGTAVSAGSAPSGSGDRSVFSFAGPSVAEAAERGGQEAFVIIRDSTFRPGVLRVPVGTTVVWQFEGRLGHTVTADDGAFDSGIMERGSQFRITFDEPGRYPFYCIPHGQPGGHGMAGVIIVGDVDDEDDLVPTAALEPRPEGPVTLRVPDEYPTIQAAVDAAFPYDMVLISPGVYHEAVVVTTSHLTIRGLDRNEVILDGDYRLDNGIMALGADQVVMENMTARNYLVNGFYWTGAHGYRGSYLTAHNNGDYGIYAFDSRFGQFDNSYASGSPDSGFYIGQCRPCHALITNVISEFNGLGYSGTNAGGNLTIMNSLWQHNLGGIVPNTLDSQDYAPQGGTRIVNNVVIHNGDVRATGARITYPAMGGGILIAGGNDNVVEGNWVVGNPTYGIGIMPNIDRNFWTAHNNVVRGNWVRDSGRTDLTLAAPAGRGNCFAFNDVGDGAAAALDRMYGCDGALSRLGGGDVFATVLTLARVAKLEFGGGFVPTDWRTRPRPGPQPNMPDPLAPAKAAYPTLEWESIPGPVTESVRGPLPEWAMEMSGLAHPRD